MKKRGIFLDLFLLFFLIAVSVYPRLWSLELSPKVIVDEPAYLRDINLILQKGPGFYVADFQWDFSQATLYYYPTLLLAYFLKTHPNLLTLRLSSVIFSLAALIPFYFLAREYTGRAIAFCLTLLFSFSYYYLQFSRVGWGVVYTTSLGLYLIWFLKQAITKGRWFWFVISGVIAGLILYGYRAGEIYLVAGFLYLFYMLITNYDWRKSLLAILLFFGSFLLTCAPWFYQISRNWELYNLRHRVVNVFNTERPYHGLWDNTDILKYQVATTFKSWILLEAIDGGGVENPRYLPLKDPPVNPAIRFLFIIGLILTIAKFRETYIWLIIFILGLIFGQILTVDPPNGSRALIFLPVIYLFSAFTLEKIYQFSGRKKLALIVITILSLGLAYADFAYYQYWMDWIQV